MSSPDPRPLYHLRLVGVLHEQQTQNGFYFTTASHHSGDDHLADCNAIIERFNAGVMPYIKEFANTEWHYLALVCATMIPKYGPIMERVFESGSGNQPDESLPPYVAGLLSLRTGYGGKSANGRLYFAGVSEGDHQGGRLTPDSLARLQGIGNSLIGFFGAGDIGNDFHYGLYSHKLGDVASGHSGEGPTLTMAGFRPINTTVGRAVTATQKHRQIGHGG